MSADYRVEWRWLLMGPLLGYFSGMVTVALLGVLSPPLLLVTIPFGLVVGGPIGAGVGLFAGLPLVFLVGPHLSRRSAVRRAALLGAALSPIVLLIAVELVPVLPGVETDLAAMITWLGPFPYAAATVLGGVTAARTARIDMPRTGVS